MSVCGVCVRVCVSVWCECVCECLFFSRMSLSFEKGCHFVAKAGSVPPAHLPQPPECCEKHVLSFGSNGNDHWNLEGCTAGVSQVEIRMLPNTYNTQSIPTTNRDLVQTSVCQASLRSLVPESDRNEQLFLSSCSPCFSESLVSPPHKKEQREDWKSLFRMFLRN